MTTHVFIVNSTTFKYHLEYLFAGTGAKAYRIDFNNKSNTQLLGRTENLLVSMIADANRVRTGDLIIFYLQQNPKSKVREGKFYGIFKASNDSSFLDNNDRQQYLSDELQKSLTFRTLIRPYKVYAAGVTEWEALDEIKRIRRPEQMLWSLIYRKLKGNRGNTMITPYESKQLCSLIRNKNRGQELRVQNRLLSFDMESQCIICINRHRRAYRGRKVAIGIEQRLLRKVREKKLFEPHLQAYIVEKLGKSQNLGLDACVLGGGVIEWIGNEVSCGVGMQRIDVLVSIVRGRQRTAAPIELKTATANEQCVVQIERYVDWLQQYYVPNWRSQLMPVLVSRKIAEKKKIDGSWKGRYKKLIRSFEGYNQSNKGRCRKLKYIEFDIKGDKVVFEEMLY